MKLAIQKLKAATQSRKDVRLVVQKNGKLFDAARIFLYQYGIRLPSNRDKSLIFYPIEAPGLEIAFVRQSDIPWYLESGNADFGIIGMDQLAEIDSKLPIVDKLGLGRCTLSIAVPKGSSITAVQDLRGKSIATSFPRVSNTYLKNNGVSASPVELGGSVEVAASLGIVDAICDLVETGETLRANGLKPILKVMDSEAVLLQSPTPVSSGSKIVSLNRTPIQQS